MNQRNDERKKKKKIIRKTRKICERRSNEKMYDYAINDRQKLTIFYCVLIDHEQFEKRSTQKKRSSR